MNLFLQKKNPKKMKTTKDPNKEPSKPKPVDKLKPKELIKNNNTRSLIQLKPDLSQSTKDSNAVPIENFILLKNELDAKEEHIKQLKYSSVETILEKETIIYDLQCKLQDFEKTEMKKIIENLENKINLLEEELYLNQKLLAEEKEKNKKKNSVEFHKNIQEIIKVKTKESETLLDMLREQDDKAVEINKVVGELQENVKKYEKELKSANDANAILKEERSQFIIKVKNLENKIHSQENEISFLKSEISQFSSNYENEKKEFCEKLEKKDSEIKKMLESINELKTQNSKLKVKNCELNEMAEGYLQKCEDYVKELNEAKEKYSEMLSKKPENKPIKETIIKNKNKIPLQHKRTLSQELGVSPDSFFSFIEHEHHNFNANINFSTNLNENFSEFIKKEKQNLVSKMAEVNSFSLITESFPAKNLQNEERLSTVEDHLSENYETPFQENKLPLSSKHSFSSFKYEEKPNNKEMEEIKQENFELNNEVNQLKFLIEQLQKEKEAVLAENLDHKNSIAKKNLELEGNLDSISKLCSQLQNLEQKTNAMKLEFDEEKKELEAKAIEANLKYACIMTERDEFELKYKQLHRKIQDRNKFDDKNEKKKSFFDFLFCN